MSKCARILLVEDSRLDIALTMDAFRQLRLANQVTIVTDGEEALDFLFGRGPYADRNAHPLPDLVLLDLNLPKVDGHEVLREVKASAKLKRVPVIMLTSSREEGDRALSYDMGANSYIVKPLSFDGFLNVVRKIEDYWLTLNVGPPED
jgi:DNA-binding response OmpR family regulator